MCKEYTASIAALTEVCSWLDGYPICRRIEAIIAQLRAAPLTEWQKWELRHTLSHEVLFHVKCLGDYYVKGFPCDGSHYPWWNYLSRVCEICQKDLE